MSLEKIFLNEAHVALAALERLLTWSYSHRYTSNICIYLHYDVLKMEVARTGVDEDVPLEVVVGSERGVAVDAHVTLGVLDAQRSIVIDAEDLQQ